MGGIYWNIRPSPKAEQINSYILNFNIFRRVYLMNPRQPPNDF